jgi:cytochrome c553
MKLITPAIAILALVSASAAAYATDDRGRSPGQILSDNNCAWCHGPSLQGYTTAPRLAGQRAEYVVNQILNFKAHSRDNPLSKQVMWGATRTVSPEAAQALSAYFASLPAEPANDGNGNTVDTGRTLYRDGSAGSNIPSCAICHGPEGQGVGAIPRLGGLSYRYLKRKLEQWNEGYHAAALAPMPAVSSSLSPTEIDAISSYLSFVH